MSDMTVDLGGPCSAYRALVLAHAVERARQAGTVTTDAEAARRIGVSAQHMKFLRRLIWLAPDLQAAVLDGTWDVAEYRLRDAARYPEWKLQLRIANGVGLTNLRQTK